VTDTRVVCASHSPLMYCAASEPSSEAEICEAFEARAAEVATFKPDVIFAFGPDHYTSMFHSMAPVFCIGTRCEAIGDIGGFAGRLDVPTELATECIASRAGKWLILANQIARPSSHSRPDGIGP
jgi:2,3-dihydroxyphenylpropionate 1,2-dioxygenase